MLLLMLCETQHENFSASLVHKLPNSMSTNARRGVFKELLYADDLVIMSEDMEDLKERFWN